MFQLVPTTTYDVYFFTLSFPFTLIIRIRVVVSCCVAALFQVILVRSITIERVYLLCFVFWCFVSFLYGVPGQVRNLVVSIPDRCLLLCSGCHFALDLKLI